MEWLPKGQFRSPYGQVHQPYELDTEFSVSRGSVVALVGESGVGKSFFARALVDTLRHRVGRSSILNVAYVPQDPQLFIECSIRQNIRLLSGGASEADVLGRCLDTVRRVVEEYEHCSPQVLSGGQRRLLGLACALASSATLIVLDETLVSLDPRTLNLALDSVRSVARADGRSIVVVTHDRQIVRQADVVYEVTVVNGARRISITESAVAWKSELHGPPKNEQSNSEDVLGSKGDHTRWWFLGMNSVGAALALLGVIGLLMLPGFVGTPQAQSYHPSLGDVGLAFKKTIGTLASEGAYSTGTAAVAFCLALALSGLFGLTVQVLGSRSRVVVMATWIALQGVPVVVFAQLMQRLLDIDDRWLLVTLTACFVAVFPLAMMVGRIIVATPTDVFRATAAGTCWKRFLVAGLWNKGSIVRAVVACSPLAAIGVVVGEYVVGDRGLGHLMWITFSGGGEVSVRYVYALACSAIGLILFLSTTLAAVMVLPRDVALD